MKEDRWEREGLGEERIVPPKEETEGKNKRKRSEM